MVVLEEALELAGWADAADAAGVAGAARPAAVDAAGLGLGLGFGRSFAFGLFSGMSKSLGW